MAATLGVVSTRPPSPNRVEAIAKILIQNCPSYGPGVLLAPSKLLPKGCLEKKEKKSNLAKAIVATPATSGNWVEDRIECQETGSFYFPPKEHIDYKKMKPESRQPDFRQNKLNSTQSNVATIIRHDSHDKCPNYATTNDLVYNHLPKPLCGPIQRYYKKGEHQFYPQPDLLKCFGNVTEWGLKELMEYEWRCTDVSDYISSLYTDTFVPPQPHQYLQANERKARNSKFTKSFRYKMTKSKR